MTLLRISDVCQVLGIKYQSLYMAVISGVVPAQRDATGNRGLIREEHIPEIRKWSEQR